MSGTEIAADAAKVATDALEAAPAIEAGVTTVSGDIQTGHPLTAASDAASALSSTLSTVAASGTIGNKDTAHVTLASELAGLLSKFLALLADL